MQAVILTGGLGTRAKLLSPDLPKSLIEVDSKPFISYQCELLSRQGFKEILLCVGYKGDKICEFVGDGSRFGLSVNYSIEESDNLLGTGGAILNAIDYLEPNFLVLYGDSYLDIDYKKVKEKYYQSGLDSLMVIYKNRNQYDKSNVEFDGSRIIKYSKAKRTSKMHFIDYGINLFKKYLFSNYHGPKKFDLSELQEDLVEKREVEAYETTKRFYHIGDELAFHEFDKMIRRKKYDNN